MPPSVDSTYTESACLTGSAPKKRKSCLSKANLPAEDLRKKSRGSSARSETSPRRRAENVHMMEQVTQESQKQRYSPDSDECIGAVKRQEGFAPYGQRHDDYRTGNLGKEGRRAGEGMVDECIRSMIVHSGSLARSILAAYEKEREQLQRNNSAILEELAQLRAFGEAAAAELPQLRTFREAARTELAQLQISNDAAAAEIAKLQSENANLAKKDATTSSKLDELQRQCTTTQAVHIVAAFVMSKALMIREVAELTSSKMDRLRLENAKLIDRLREIEEEGRVLILNLQSSLAAAKTEVIELSSEKAELAKEKADMEASARSTTHDLLCRLAAAKEDATRVHSTTEALLREKDEAAARAAHAAAVEVKKMESHNETLRREMQTAMEMSGREMEKMHSAVESTAANVRKLFHEKAEIAREKAESEARSKVEIAHLLSEKAALVVQQDKTSATVAREFKKLRSGCDNAVEKLTSVRQAAGLEKAKFQSEIKAKKSELERLKKKLAEAQAHMAFQHTSSAAEIDILTREKVNSHAREAALLEKLQKLSPRPRSEMHLAFLFNWGLLRPGEHNFKAHGCS